MSLHENDEPGGIFCPRCADPLVYDLDEDVFECERCGFVESPHIGDWFDEVMGG